jgi:hypothetical protein
LSVSIKLVHVIEEDKFWIYLLFIYLFIYLWPIVLHRCKWNNNLEITHMRTSGKHTKNWRTTPFFLVPSSPPPTP